MESYTTLRETKPRTHAFVQNKALCLTPPVLLRLQDYMESGRQDDSQVSQNAPVRHRYSR